MPFLKNGFTRQRFGFRYPIGSSWLYIEIDAPPNSLKDSNVNLKMKIMKEGVGVWFFIHNTTRVKKVCWSSKIRTKMSDKWVNYSYRSMQIKQQVGYCIIRALWCTNEPRTYTDSQDSPRHGLGGSHHLPAYSILCDLPLGLHPNGIFPGTPKSEVPQFLKLGLLPLWMPITSCANLWLKQGLK